VKDTLENRGVLGHIKARVRAEVFNALDDEKDDSPPLSNENMLINELIREYLEFNKYKYSASVLQAGVYLMKKCCKIINLAVRKMFQCFVIYSYSGIISGTFFPPY